MSDNAGIFIDGVNGDMMGFSVVDKRDNGIAFS
jgi:hypothetical protein